MPRLLKYKRLALTIMSLFLIPIAHAQSQKTDIRPNANRIVGDALLAEFEDTTHSGAYNFTDDGDPRRFYTETTRGTGRTIYTENDITTEGVWTVRRDMLCFMYNSSDFSGGCFRVYKVGNCFYYYSDNVIEFPGELDRNYWTARSVKGDEKPNCEPGLS